MRYTVFKFEQEAMEGSLTYVDGLGFISANNRLRHLRSLKRCSAFFCFLILLFFICQRTLTLPFLYIGYYAGLNIQIYPATGWIQVADTTAFFLALLVDFVSMMLPIGLASFVYRDLLSAQRPLTKVRRNGAHIAIPLLLAFSIVGSLFTEVLQSLSRSLGFVLTNNQTPPAYLSSAFLPYYDLASGLLFAVLSTVFVHGIALRSLRRFGDGFAIFGCGLLSMLLSGNPLDSIPAFLFSIGAGYFVIRGNSLRPVLCAKILYVLLSFGNDILPRVISSASLIETIRLTAALILITLAVLAYIHFLRMDAHAFRLVHPNDGLSNKKKFINFCSSFFFILLIFRLITKLAEMIDFLG